MTMPNFIFGTLISIFFGSIFHVWQRGNGKKLLLYLFLSFAGFWAGHYLGTLIEINFMIIGPLNLGLGIVSSIVGLFSGHFLSQISQDQY